MNKLIISDSSDLVNIADAIRSKTGGNDSLSLDEMVIAINSIEVGGGSENLNTELNTQATLLSEQDAKIAELAEILAGKASGGSENVTYNTCTIKIVGNLSQGYVMYQTYVDGELSCKCTLLELTTEQTLNNIVCGSMIVVPVRTDCASPIVKINGSVISVHNTSSTAYPGIRSETFVYCIFNVPAMSGQTINIVCDNYD